MDFLKNKNIYLTPKNNFTVALKDVLKNKNILIKYFLDSVKKDVDIITKTFFEKNDVLIIFSPNHYKEIIAKLEIKNIFFLDVKNDKFILIPIKEFKGYTQIPKLNCNKFNIQKHHWAEHLRVYENGNKNIEEYGYEWGNPTKGNDELGNYLSIKNKLEKTITSNSTILELGTLGGKWTKYMLNAKQIICVDINDYFINVIKKRYSSNINKFSFYISQGNELKEIKNNSIDIIFCIDTLVRVEKKYICDYIKEIARVLTNKGKAIIHIPNYDIEDCRNRNFTNINTHEIKIEFNKYFKNFILDSQTINHGTLVYINY